MLLSRCGLRGCLKLNECLPFLFHENDLHYVAVVAEEIVDHGYFEVIIIKVTNKQNAL